MKTLWYTDRIYGGEFWVSDVLEYRTVRNVYGMPMQTARVIVESDDGLSRHKYWAMLKDLSVNVV